MASSPIQTRFDGGEISPRLGGRFDSEVYARGLAKCENFIPQPQGSLLMRAGFSHVTDLGLDARVRLIRIKTSFGDRLMTLGNYEARVFSIVGGVATENSFTLREFLQNNDFATGSDPGVVLSTKAPAAWSIGSNTNMVYNGWPSVWPDSPYKQYAVLNVSGTQRGIDQAITVPVSSYFTCKVTAAGNGPSQMIFKISTTPPIGSGGGEIQSQTVNIPGLTSATYTMTQVVVPAGTYFISVQCLSGLVLVGNIQAEAIPSVASYILSTPWSLAEVADVQFATETGRDRTVFVHSQHRPWALHLFDPATTYLNRDKFQAYDIYFLDMPVGWGISPTINWPAAVEIHDGRICYAGEPAKRNRFLGSVSGAPDEFTLGADPGNALDYEISTKGSLRWLQSSKVLLAGTDISEHSITGSKRTPLVGDTQITRESAFGSAAIQAVDAGPFAVYVSADRRKIRAALYDLQNSGWESREVTFLAEHITKNALIKDLNQVWAPENTLAATLESGEVLMVVFEPGEQVVAAWRLVHAVGDVKTVALSSSDIGSFIWAGVFRGGRLWLEVAPLSEPNMTRFLDSAVSATSNSSGIVAGLTHLSGATVRVATSTYQIGDFVVPPSGEIDIGTDFANLAVVVGLSYTAEATTLPKNIKTGKTTSSKLGVVLNNSAMPYLNGYLPEDRTPGAPQNIGEPVVTGKREVGNSGWGDEGKVTITQYAPFRTEVLALYESTVVGKV